MELSEKRKQEIKKYHDQNWDDYHYKSHFDEKLESLLEDFDLSLTEFIQEHYFVIDWNKWLKRKHPYLEFNHHCHSHMFNWVMTNFEGVDDPQDHEMLLELSVQNNPEEMKKFKERQKENYERKKKKEEG